MNFFRRNLITTAPAALGLLLFAGAATASTITGSTTTMGSITAFSAGSSSTVSAGQFNQAMLDAAIQAACPVNATCSGSTLTEIDFSLQVNLTGSVGVVNTNSGTAYIGPLGGTTSSNNGSYGSATSGTAIAEIVTVDLTDGITNGIDVEDIPTFSVATTNEFKNANCTVVTGITSSHFANCLAVSAGSHSFTGTGSDTESGSYTGDLSGETSTYVGTGMVNLTIAAAGGETSGSLPSNVTIPTNSATISALSNALVITYDYSYTEVVAPEPTTMALVGGALLAVGLIRRKRLS